MDGGLRSNLRIDAAARVSIYTNYAHSNGFVGKGNKVSSTDGKPTPTPTHRGGGIGLSSKLLVLTVVFVMVVEIFIFLPSMANFRNNWLANKLATARVASVVISSTDEVPKALEDTLFRLTGALALAIQNDDRRRMIFRADNMVTPDYEVRLGEMVPHMAIVESFGTLFHGERVMRVIDRPIDGEIALEMIVREDALRDAMLAFGRNILILSLIISIVTAALVYLSLRWLFVRPMVRMSKNMQAFSDNPESASHIITPSTRRDEIGEAESRLRSMQEQLSKTLNQQRHLADLGLAVSKINHDLRNILASAQLFSDRLSDLPDPTVQRFAPKLIASLDRAIGYTHSVLSYSKPQEAPPEFKTFDLHVLINEVGDSLGLGFEGPIEWQNNIESGTLAHADPEQLFRVVMNLCRNSVQALNAHETADGAHCNPCWLQPIGKDIDDSNLGHGARNSGSGQSHALQGISRVHAGWRYRSWPHHRSGIGACPWGDHRSRGPGRWRAFLHHPAGIGSTKISHDFRAGKDHWSCTGGTSLILMGANWFA